MANATALASGQIDEMARWVAIHQRQIGDADYSVPTHYSDARPHLPTKGLICIGRNSCTDYYFIDPRARTADGTCPVLLYLHEVAFACEVVAPSVASFAGYQVARMWAERECASHLAKRLQPQKTAVAAIDRDDVQIGDARLDEALEIRGEPPHILPLFTPELRALLHSLLDGAYEVTLLDTGVVLARHVSFSDAASLHHALGAVVQATLLLDHARQVRDVAAFRLSGDLGGGLALAAYPVWVARNHWATEVFVRFATPLGLGLFVRPASWNDAAGALFAGQDLSVGDPAFDGPFVVQSWAPAALVAGVLDAEVRREVLGLLARVGPVHLRDDGVALRANYVLSRAEDVWDMGRAVAPIAARLMANADRARRA